MEITFQCPDEFLAANINRYPNLDPDFIVQICFEHPTRFDELLPHFDPALHAATKMSRTVEWMRENVRYDGNKPLDFWYDQFDEFVRKNETRYEIFTHMVANKRWPFPPVIIEAEFAIALGATNRIGTPYHLIEGTHRVSYMRRMLEKSMVLATSVVEFIEVRPSGL